MDEARRGLGQVVDTSDATHGRAAFLVAPEYCDGDVMPAQENGAPGPAAGLVNQLGPSAVM